MKIYTKGGDQGETSLFGGGRVGKDHSRVATYGEVDELNAQLGVAIAWLSGEADAALRPRLSRVQHQLFTVGAHLATPEYSRAQSKLPELDPDWAHRLEREIDEADGVLTPLKHFVLPGGSKSAAALHYSRTICRRAERAIVALTRLEPVAPEVIVYMNRLSDWLFVTARLANHHERVDEPLWIP